jgi:tRNA nucleotidyltransferase (CCA-adding enzyme)
VQNKGNFVQSPETPISEKSIMPTTLVTIPPTMDAEIRAILAAIATAGGAPYCVGGAVRDAVAGHAFKDIDVEVFGLLADALIDILKRFGQVDTVGMAFGVIKLTTQQGDYDFSLPRRDNKRGQSHRDFTIEVDLAMTVEEAAARRDFTMNSMALAIDNTLLDPFHGRADMQAKILRHTSAAFAEDPLRVLRGMQFAARFGMTLAPETAQLAAALKSEYPALSIERVWGEWEKWAAGGKYPAKGLEALEQSGWLALYPELAALRGVQQDPEWHPEGDAWVHTKWVTDAAARIADREALPRDERVALLLGALCHDLGKAVTTVFARGRWRSPGHDEAGARLARTFLASIGAPDKVIGKVTELTLHHMAHLYGVPNARVARRLGAKLTHVTPYLLGLVMEADHSGRPPLAPHMPVAATKLVALMEQEAGRSKPLLMGRHLLELGLKPGPALGALLQEAFEAQLDGAFADVAEGIAWLRAQRRL